MAKPPGSSTLNWVNTPSTGNQSRSTAPCDGVHRIRVDFKRDLDAEKVWEAGGLGLLTSVPVTPRVLCFLCASSGNVEVKSKATNSAAFSSNYPLAFLSSETPPCFFFFFSYIFGCSLSSARYAVNRSTSFAWGSLSALSRSSLRTGAVDGADSARPADASTRKLK